MAAHLLLALLALEPPTLLADSPARYPEACLSGRHQGEVRLELLIDERGEVASAEVVSGWDADFQEAALHASVGLRFTPAELEGVAVPVRMLFSYFFEPPPEPKRPPTSLLRGVVRSKGNRRPIPGAKVKSSLGPAAETGPDGQFTLELPPIGQLLDVGAPGFKPWVFREDLARAGALEVIYSLEPLELNPYETIVHGERERTEVARVSLQEQEIREVPGTMGDPFRVVMLLPGVSSILSGVAYPVVRGSSPASTGYFLDGIRVPLLFHLFLGPAVVHPDFIDGIDFYPGGVPVRYGRLLGGVIDGRVSRPREKGPHATAYADLINAGGFAEYTVENTGTNFTLAGRLSYTPWLIALAANSFAPESPQKVVMDFSDYQARVEQRLSAGRLRLLAFGSADVVGTVPKEGQSGGALSTIAFHRVDLRYRRPLTVGDAELGVTYGLDRFKVESTESLGRAEFVVDQQDFVARAGWSGKLAEGIEASVGADLDHKRADLLISYASGPDVQPQVATTARAPLAIGTFFGAYGELLWKREPRWTWVPGVRFDNYHLVPGIDHWSVEPRVTARYQLLEELVLKGAFGFFHQQPTLLIQLPVVDIASLRYGLQEGVQASVGAEWRALRNIEVTAELYVNPLLRTMEITFLDDEQRPPPQGGEPDPFSVALPGRAEDYSSHGYAYGFELMVRHPLGENWFGWISYSLQHSARWGEYAHYNEHGERVATYRGYLPFLFDQTHVFNAVLSYRFRSGWTAGGVLHFNTGRPEMGGLTSHTQVVGTDRAGWPRWVRLDKDRVDRLPPFFRVDFRVAKSWAFDTFTLDAYLDFLNASISQEVVAFSYGFEERAGVLKKEAQGVAIPLPILGVKGTY
ncbi:MAG: TonB-dependent receptor [Myxococcales bacterium]|nr:TonB-dependent receptor [Myxococcales bacterium]